MHTGSICRGWLLLSILSILISGCGQGFSPTLGLNQAIQLLSVNCDLEQGYNISPGAQVLWYATKVGADVVEGKQALTGTIKGPQETLDGAEMLLDFNPSSLDSTISVRDERIKEHIFGLSQNFPLQFELTDLTSPTGSLIWPTEGQTLQVDLSGSISVFNISNSITIPVLVSREGDGYRVQNVNELGYDLDVRNTLGLTDQVANLLALVPGVEMQDIIQVKFDFSMVPACQ